jgi:hypothetical protein
MHPAPDTLLWLSKKSSGLFQQADVFSGFAINEILPSGVMHPALHAFLFSRLHPLWI